MIISLYKGIATIYANVCNLVVISTSNIITTKIATVNYEVLKVSLYIFIPILLIAILAIIVMVAFQYDPRWFSSRISALKAILSAITSKVKNNNKIEKALEETGFTYDPVQDMFYSIMDAWQRQYGYCRLYDEAATPTNMIIDCEPIYFEYDDKRWMIEFWKGQYGMTTGGEIGVFSTDGPDLNIPGFFNGTFYNSVSDKDRLHLSFVLEKNGTKLFTRDDIHWWLTGFRLGEFAEPSQLTMKIDIALKDRTMRNAFIEGLENAGYTDDELYVRGNTVSFEFDKPHTPQPLTRTAVTDWIIQRKNELLCNKYRELTSSIKNMPKKLKLMKKKTPVMIEEITNIRKSKQTSEIYENLMKHSN